MPRVVSFDAEFSKLGEPEITLLAECDVPFAHEAGVWLPSTREVFYTSAQYDVHGDRRVLLGLIDHDTGAIRTILPKDPIAMGNGAVNFEGGIVVCQQGHHDTAGALKFLDPKEPWTVTNLVDNFYGQPFNAPNDVVVLALDRTLWFTDPDYAQIHRLRSQKCLPNMVYCYNPRNKRIRSVTDEIRTPNGIAFSPDYKLCYITDTSAYGDCTSVSPESNPSKPPIVRCKPSTIYVFDVVLLPKGSGYTLANKRLFAFSSSPAPDGIKVDTDGNVYSGCSDGIHVWNPDGVLLGKYEIDGGVANFVFTDPGTIIALNETRIYKITGLTTRGALDYTL